MDPKLSKKIQKSRLKPNLSNFPQINTPEELQSSESPTLNSEMISALESRIQLAINRPELTNVAEVRQWIEDTFKKSDIGCSDLKQKAWECFLRFEYRFGNPFLFAEVMKRAIFACGIVAPVEFALRLYSEDRSFAEGEALVNGLVKRSKDKLATAFLKIEFLVQWREWLSENLEMRKIVEEKVFLLMEQLLKSLPPKNHIQSIQKYALLEYKYGNFAYARRNFENILKKVPDRIEVLTAYVEAEIKHTQDADYVRSLYERMTSIKTNLKLMQNLFKKYVEFEELFGNPESVECVKAKSQRCFFDYLSSRSAVV